MGEFRRQLGESAAAFRAVLGNQNLRRLEVAAIGSTLGGGAYSIAISVYAYHVGGASAVGLLWLIRSAAGAISAPLGGSIADRYRRELVMLWCEVLRTALMVGIAVAVTQGAGTGTIYALSALISVVGNAFIPAERSITPSLANTPAELTAANVLASTIESVGTFVGPALAGILLAVTSIEVVLFFSAGLLLWSAFYVALIRPPRAAATVVEAAEGEEAPAAETLVTELLAGFKAIAGDERLRILVPILAATTFLVGGMEVLVVSIGINLLDIGNAGVGYLNTAFGVGALVGALITAGLVGLRRLSVPFVVGAMIAGIPVALIGAHPQVALAVIWLGVLGAGNTLLEVSGLTLVQRAVPDNVLARAFGAIDLVWLGSVGLGAIVAPALIHGIGIRWTLVAIGCFLPTIVLVFGPRLLGIDARALAPAADRLALLRGTPIFAPLSGVTLESLAARLIPLEMDAGAVVIREGDSGDRFYLIASGEVAVTAQGNPVATLGPGDYVGEIALLRDVPRTATVTAKVPVTLYALERDDFLSAVTSHAASRTQAESVVGSRLTGLQRATGRIVSSRF